MAVCIWGDGNVFAELEDSYEFLPHGSVFIKIKEKRRRRKKYRKTTRVNGENTVNERYFRSPLELFPKNYTPQKRMQYALNGVMMMMMAMSLISLVLVVEPLQQQQSRQLPLAFSLAKKIVMCNTQ